MTAKYLTGMSEMSGTMRAIANAKVSGKTAVVPVAGIRRQEMSALEQPVSDAEFVAVYGQERNFCFFTPETDDRHIAKNTIRACLFDD